MQGICYEADVALIAIIPGFQVQPVTIVPQRYRSGVNDRVFSIGFDNGGESSLIESRITSIGRFSGAATFMASTAPVEGRSGGGIFTIDGQLLGICNCAEYTEDKGIYAASSSLYDELKEHKLLAMFQQQPEAEMIGKGSSPNMGVTFDQSIERLGAASGTEVICIIRDANGQSRTVKLDQASPGFMQALNAEQLRQNGSTFADRR